MATLKQKTSMALLASVAFAVMGSASAFGWQFDPTASNLRPPGDPNKPGQKATMDFAPQNYGIYDTYYDWFREADCRECHGASVADRHHSTRQASVGDCLYCHCGWPAVVPVVRDCQSCHTDTYQDGNGNWVGADPCGTLNAADGSHIKWPRDAWDPVDNPNGKKMGSPHHRSRYAAAKNCVACHSPKLLVQTNSVTTPDYRSSAITPTPQACENCHWPTNCNEKNPRGGYNRNEPVGGGKNRGAMVDPNSLVFTSDPLLRDGVRAADSCDEFTNNIDTTTGLEIPDSDKFTRAWKKWPNAAVRGGQWHFDVQWDATANGGAGAYIQVPVSDGDARSGDGFPKPSASMSGVGVPAPIMPTGPMVNTGYMGNLEADPSGYKWKLADNKAFLANYGTHHAIGWGNGSGNYRIYGAIYEDCATCHAQNEAAQYRTNPSQIEYPYYIRSCENCHDINTLHDIKEHVREGGENYAIDGRLDQKMPSVFGTDPQTGFAIENSDKCVGCHGIGELPPSPKPNLKKGPVIDGVFPPVAIPGFQLTIYGRNFGGIKGTVLVDDTADTAGGFNPVAVTSWSDTEIVITVPGIVGTTGFWAELPQNANFKVVRPANDITGYVDSTPESTVKGMSVRDYPRVKGVTRWSQWDTTLEITGTSLVGGVGVDEEKLQKFESVYDPTTGKKVKLGWASYVYLASSNDAYRVASYENIPGIPEDLTTTPPTPAVPPIPGYNQINAILKSGKVFDVYTGKPVPQGQLFVGDWSVFVVTDYIIDDGDGVYFDAKTGKLDLADETYKMTELPAQIKMKGGNPVYKNGKPVVRPDLLDSAFGKMVDTDGDTVPDTMVGGTTGDRLIARLKSPSAMVAMTSITKQPFFQAVTPKDATAFSTVTLTGFNLAAGKSAKIGKVELVDPVSGVVEKTLSKKATTGTMEGITSWSNTKVTFQMPNLTTEGPRTINVITPKGAKAVALGPVSGRTVNFVLDACPDDPKKMRPGVCGCGIADADTDGDGTITTADCDACPSDPLKMAPGLCGCGIAEPAGDTNGDGTIDAADCI